MVPNFDGLQSAFVALTVLAIFGLWKLVDIFVWIVLAIFGD